MFLECIESSVISAFVIIDIVSGYGELMGGSTLPSPCQQILFIRVSRICILYLACKCSFGPRLLSCLYIRNCILWFSLIFLYDLSMSLAVTIE